MDDGLPDIDKGASSSAEGARSGRRKFLLRTVGSACAAGVFTLMLMTHVKRANALPSQALRPPGALPEDAFDAACIRCGLCVRACPYATLTLAPLGAGIPVGTPYFEARSVPCEMCQDIPCKQACPTGALSPSLEKIEAARMGIAVVADPERCLSLQGIHCDACYLACPLKGKAITMERLRKDGGRTVFFPTVHSDACTGCGKCEHDCVPEIAVIRVLPIAEVHGGLERGRRRETSLMGLPKASTPAVNAARRSTL